jgi:iron complex outermembrane receptor protein
VQVLKGPQGTLFGTSTNGGAILNEPHRPDADFGGYVSGTVGNYARKTLEAVINAPLSDAVQLRAGVSWNDTRGYVRDGTNGQRYGNDDYVIARLGLNIKPSESVENYLVLNYYDSKGERPSFTPAEANPALGTFAALAPIIAQQAALGPYNLVGTSIVGGNKNRRKLFNLVNQTNVDISDTVRLRNIFSYSTAKTFSRFDADGSPLPLFDNNVTSVAPGADKQVSEEFQVQAKLGSRFDLTVGTFHQWFKAGTTDDTLLDDLSAAFGILVGSRVISRKSRTHAVFAEGTYNFGSDDRGLRLTGGVRYTVDNVDLVQTNSVWIRLGPDQFLDLADIGAVPHTDYDLHETFKRTTFKGGLQYVFDNRRMAYFTVSRGYSAGGFNTGNPFGREAFEPESLTNYEFGVKADWGSDDVRVRTNFAVFYGKYNNVQVSTTQSNCTDPSNPATCTFAVGTFNAAKANVKGAEFELLVSAGPNVEFGGNGSYNKNEYTDYINDPDGPGPLPAQDLSGQPFVYNPKFKYSLFGTIRAPLQDMGELSFTANYSYSAKLITTATPMPQSFDRQPGYGTLDARIDWDGVLGSEGLSASLFVTNLTKNTKTDGGFGAYRSLGLRGLSVAVPRQFGLRLRYDF